MTLQQLHQVITIAESRSMNEASRKLFVSQPNLSAVVRELEEEAGITIFIRSNRGIVLTLEGEEFIGYAKQVVEQYHLLESRYISSASKKKFSVSMQHYTFAVKAFVVDFYPVLLLIVPALYVDLTCSGVEKALQRLVALSGAKEPEKQTDAEPEREQCLEFGGLSALEQAANMNDSEE